MERRQSVEKRLWKLFADIPMVFPTMWREDLLEMADELKLLDKTRRGKQYYFVAPNGLERRIARP